MRFPRGSFRCIRLAHLSPNHFPSSWISFRSQAAPAQGLVPWGRTGYWIVPFIFYVYKNLHTLEADSDRNIGSCLILIQTFCLPSVACTVSGSLGLDAAISSNPTWRCQALSLGHCASKDQPLSPNNAAFSKLCHGMLELLGNLSGGPWGQRARQCA